GEWMGSWWRDSNKSTTSIESPPSNQERPSSPGGEDTEQGSTAKKEPQKRKTLNPFTMPSWMTSQKPDSTIATASSPDRRRPPRKLSVAIGPFIASDGSPTSSRIQPTPTSALMPTIAPQISTPPDGTPIPSSRVSVITKATKEEHPTLPSGPHPSHIRAISYATRVMSSDPHSIMVDGGVSPFIAQLGHALVFNLKEDTSFTLREGRGGARSFKEKTPPVPVASDVPLPASAVVHMEATETRATLVSNLSKTLNKKSSR
ncbi:13086_t:CDS:2, partial [Acaulospora colombiana]